MSRTWTFYRAIVLLLALTPYRAQADDNDYSASVTSFAASCPSSSGSNGASSKLGSSSCTCTPPGPDSLVADTDEEKKAARRLNQEIRNTIQSAVVGFAKNIKSATYSCDPILDPTEENCSVGLELQLFNTILHPGDIRTLGPKNPNLAGFLNRAYTSGLNGALTMGSDPITCSSNEQDHTVGVYSSSGWSSSFMLLMGADEAINVLGHRSGALCGLRFNDVLSSSKSCVGKKTWERLISGSVSAQVVREDGRTRVVFSVGIRGKFKP